MHTNTSQILLPATIPVQFLSRETGHHSRNSPDLKKKNAELFYFQTEVANKVRHKMMQDDIEGEVSVMPNLLRSSLLTTAMQNTFA